MTTQQESRHLPLFRATLATAVLMVAGAASAQVLLSGRVDQSVIKTSPGKWEVANGSSSRVILSGNEDLGSGTSAYFHLQTRFNADTGTLRTPSQFWYYSYVGLKDQRLGDLRLGNQKAPLDEALGPDYELWQGDTVAATYSRYAGGSKLWTNGVDYVTPSWGGLRLRVGTGLSEGATPVRGQGAALMYDRGGFSVAVASQRSPNNVKTSGVGASYQWEQVRVMGTWGHSERVGGNKEQTDWQLGVGYRPTPAGELRVLYNDSKLDGVTTRLSSVGYFYHLSKRTGLYGATSHTKTERQRAVEAYQVGVRHLF